MKEFPLDAAYELTQRCVLVVQSTSIGFETFRSFREGMHSRSVLVVSVCRRALDACCSITRSEVDLTLLVVHGQRATCRGASVSLAKTRTFRHY